jgi:hypothetical protein
LLTRLAQLICFPRAPGFSSVMAKPPGEGEVDCKGMQIFDFIHDQIYHFSPFPELYLKKKKKKKKKRERKSKAPGTAWEQRFLHMKHTLL